MSDSTPSTVEAMEVTSTKSVEVTMGSSTSRAPFPVLSTIAHTLAVLVSAVVVLFVGAVLADGTSVIKLKDASQLKDITNPALKDIGIHHRADELLGPTYGIGLHHDQGGHLWTTIEGQRTLPNLIENLGLPVIAAALPSVIATDALKHPVALLECKDLQMAGLAAMGLGFIALSVAVLMNIFHALVLAGLLPSKAAKPLAALVWFVLSTGFLIVVCIAIGVYTATWTCNQVIIPTIKISDHFDYNYGFPFAVVGYFSCLLILNVMLFCTSMKDGTSAQPKPEPLGKTTAKVLGGTFVGCVVGMTAGLSVLAGNGYFQPAPVADPNVNPCEGQKRLDAGPGDGYFSNTDCFKATVVQVLEQAGANVTKGYKGLLDAGDRVPITVPYDQTDLCPVNVHWHLGTEHYSAGQFDEKGKGPVDGGDSHAGDSYSRRELAGSNERLGYRCRHYDDTKEMYTKPFNWEHCVNMKVGETYEIHWPHSAAGACGTDWQYQSPFYDGVFCNDGIITIAPLNTYQTVGVQSQVFTVVNDEAYYYGDLIKGMRTGGLFAADMAHYTGSTTGTSRDNTICSRYTPITWQVDRTCHLISASSFDKLCADMKTVTKDDMSSDFYPHGSRVLVADALTANNQQSRK